MNGNDNDDMIVVPLQTAMYRVLGRQYLDWIDTSAASAGVIEDTRTQLQDLTTEWPHIPGVTTNSYRVFSMSAIAAGAQRRDADALHHARQRGGEFRWWSAASAS